MTRVAQAATAQEAVPALMLMMGWRGGFVPVFVDGEPRASFWWPLPECRSFAAGRVRALDERANAEVAFGLPVAKHGQAGPTRGTVLWARVEGKEQLARARAFKPLPSVVVQEGSSSRRLLLWWLDHELEYDRLIRANRRLAYRFGAVQKHGDPDELRVPAPGSFLRVGRSRPAAVGVSRLVPVSFGAQDLVGRLKDPPPRDQWMGRAA